MTSRTPGSDSRWDRAPSAPLSTIAWTRPITAPTSTSNPLTRTPYPAAERTSWATSALRMSALLGMHPRIGQVPPTRSRSITATVASAADARSAAFIPAMPAPITIRSTSATVVSLPAASLPEPGPAPGPSAAPAAIVLSPRKGGGPIA